ncbi:MULTISPECIES: hypothetical protein [unclassified Mameliella]|uniref:hypothetical protein n=1 Tax=Mameliella sp. LZ-28 TaxID=2484146 RepID=UPI001FF0C3B5|nr:hypothetical protein [Mameliella sp. LZ-28]
MLTRTGRWRKSSGVSPSHRDGAAAWFLAFAADRLAATVRNGELAIANGLAFVPVKMVPNFDAQSPRQPAPDVQLEIILRNGRHLLGPSSVYPNALVWLLLILEGK